MKKQMMDILACPIDKNFPLELFELVTNEEIIIEGAIYCSKCSRFFTIIEEIPIMLPDELRDKINEMGFLKRNQLSLPEKITKAAAPWHL